MKGEGGQEVKKPNTDFEIVLNDKGKQIGKRSLSGTFIAYKQRGRGKKYIEEIKTPEVDVKQKYIASLAPKEKSTPKTVKIEKKTKISSQADSNLNYNMA